ncbi:hypothetical protein NLJ89_g5509 [Agrocybe chaxingu]|uniref:Uncharacterized protein n=1 Tax=Agrocybe chaxingu TaxID=84603 RepID=A0A9W8K0M6_9AGAR|nr:hypothetical protein NLJ89_g5509 [Agrocybe chaxingu]
MVAHTRPSKSKLTFREKLAGKGVTTDNLLKKLKTLHTQLAALDQETVDTNSLNTVRTELIHTSLLLHKDRGVKAYTACYLADILRLYAPEAPYTQHELRDIFQFFFRQLSAGFKGADEPYYNEYFHLLESLSTVKSVVLVCDLPSSDELLHEIFRDLFTIVKRDFTRKVELFMADILVALIDECSSFPNDALEVIMAQFIEKNAKVDQPGYRLAVQVCNAASDRLQRYVYQYFGDLLTTSDDSEEKEQDNVQTSHELIKRLHRSCPSVLHSVIPILESEMRSDVLASRLIATSTLGEMYADKGGPELVRKYPSTWQLWLGRKADISVPVRLKCIEAIPALIGNLPEAKDALEELLRLKIYDPDEKVRAATCKIYSQLDYETALRHVSEEQLKTVVGRALDKKRSVRAEALNAAGKLYSLAYPEIENNDPAAIKQFAWIPDEVLQFTNATNEIRTQVEQILLEYIFPPPSISTSFASKEKDVDEVAWTDRLLNTMRYLSEKSVATLMGVAGLKASRPNIYDHFLGMCISQASASSLDAPSPSKDASTSKEAESKRFSLSITHIANGLPDPQRATSDLQAFAASHDQRLYKLLKTCMDPQSELKAVIRSGSEFTRKLDGENETMMIILRRASYWIVNQSCVPTLLKRVQGGEGGRQSLGGSATRKAQSALTLLHAMAKHSPALFKNHVAELCKAIAACEAEGSWTSVEVALMALAGVVRWNPELASLVDKKTNERVVKVALGENWRAAKFATRYLAFSKNKKELCAEVVESIADAISETKDDSLPVGHIASLAQLARFALSAFEAKSDVIITHLVKRVLLTPSNAELDDSNPDEEWLENEEVPDELRAKILALKVCRNRCLAHAKEEGALDIAAPVLKLLATLIEHEGSVGPDVDDDPRIKSRMRLQAAISLLHLSTVEVFANAITPKFVRLACVIQDSCFNVRIAFLTKLVAFLQLRKLPTRYNVIPFLTVLDPEVDTKALASYYVENAKKRLPPGMFGDSEGLPRTNFMPFSAVRLEHLEVIFIRLLHLLAHHPDFATDQEELPDMASYVQFYLDHVATSENISLLYHLAQRGKTVRDPESHAQSENFYIMCEIAQLLIKARATAHSWLLPAYPGKVRLPSDILRPLPSPEATNEILKTTYLPAEAEGWLIEKFKLGGSKEKKEKERKEKVPTKRKATSTKSNGTTKRRKKRAPDESDNELEEAGTSDVEMEDVEHPARSGKHRKSDTSEDAEPKQQSRAERLSARTAAKEKNGRGKKADSDPSSDG